jgi:hypothetical protein
VSRKNRRTLNTAKRKLVSALQSTHGFVGAGIGEDSDGNPVVVALVESDDVVSRADIPKELEGVPVRVEVVLRPRKQ